MKNINLIFYGLGPGIINQASIKIYDDKGNLLYCKKTCNGRVKLCLKINCCYRVIAKNRGQIINRRFYASKYINDYQFYFNGSIFNGKRNNQPITFLLNDYYYDNLPIEKGNLILWQR